MENIFNGIGKLGFGLMRPPMLEDGEIDMAQTTTMVDAFLAGGFSYFDTAWNYLGGKSEQMVKSLLVERYPRARFQVATKLPTFSVKSKEDPEAMTALSLERTGAGYFDYYLLHCVDDDTLLKCDEFDLWNYMVELKKRGTAKHIGFSFHSTADVLDDVLTKHPEMEFVQLQINYKDWEDKKIQSRACLEVAQKHGRPIIVMEPVKGGLLGALPEKAAAPLLAENPYASAASWAMRFAAVQENVCVTLSGMSSLQQVSDNLCTFSPLQPLAAAELAAVQEAGRILSETPTTGCTGCRYCVEGCPQDIRIPGILRSYDLELVYENHQKAVENYGLYTKKHGKAADCIACGACEGICPQKLPITGLLKRASELYD